MKFFLCFLIICCIVCSIPAHALPVNEDQSPRFVKRCSFFSRLIGDCDDGVEFGGNCSVLPCKDDLECKVNQNGTPTSILFGTAFATRLILFQFSNITQILGSRVEIVTPVTSFNRRFLPCFQLLGYLPSFSIKLIYIIIDLVLAYLLANITRIKQELYKDYPRLDIELDEINPWIISGLYLFNPLTIASCLSQSTIIFTNLSIILGTYYSLKNNKSYGMFWIAMATYLSFYPLMLVIPTTFMFTNSAKFRGKNLKNEIFGCAGLYVGWLTGLLILSYLFVNSWDFLSATYGFRSFFLVVFQLHAFVFVVPVSLKFSGIMAVFKSYPSIGDASLYLAFLPIYSEIVKCSGNANFFYAITLVYSTGNIILLVDVTYSMLRREFDIWNPDLKNCEITQN
ncbi:11735_t:CDS:10 [Diversispora eburnea]|uniref:11735_t:CDS:1 n=1 Tax=Diversispora eburnea TaxID=1213867 RepID=A0A9N8VLZ7_9GLOM|nr:11735_t:CDS:10 [Diversispora eburnea]